MDASSSYQLVNELDHHRSDVKAVLSLNDGAQLACASRDGCVSLWTRQHVDCNTPFVFEASFGGHDAYVNSLAHIAAEGDDTRGLLASGGNSTMILIHSLDAVENDALFCLLGHTHNVCALHYSSKRKMLASASWDGTARTWIRGEDDWVCQRVLEGHRAAVWDVKIVDDEAWECRMLTASGESTLTADELTDTADGEIWMWNDEGNITHRLKCCPEPVRSLTILSTGEFASASNDG